MIFFARKHMVVSVCVLSLVVVLLVTHYMYDRSHDFGSQVVFSRALSERVVVLDPGHGGVDGGASNPDDVEEEVINLEVSFILRDYLEQAGAVVVLTRKEDRWLGDLDESASIRQQKQADLKKRVEIINSAGADVMLSIHCNASTSSRFSGAQTFYYPEGHATGKLLAEYIQAEMVSLLGNTTRSPSTISRQYVLRNSDMAAVTVEMGFLSHPTEGRLLAREDYQRQVAWAIFVGVSRFFYDDCNHLLDEQSDDE